MRIREQATHLGLEVKPKTIGNVRYSISDEQFKMLQEFKLGAIKTQTEEKNYCARLHARNSN